VTNRMHIEIYKYPAWGDVVEIETWCQEDGRIGTRRDWILEDLANGEVIGRATRYLLLEYKCIMQGLKEVHQCFILF